jgi:NAD(P)-dependent dehydrogenase (short-subunit alcohol dehydrogenase family)
VHGLYPPSTHHLRLAFAIPGVLHPEKSPAQIDANKALDTFKINTIGPMLIMKHFSAFLPKKKMHILNSDEYGLPPFAVYCSMAARVGSTTDNQKGGWYSYRASKAGVTSVMKTFDLYLQQTSGDQAIAIALHPGTVKTGLSKDYWDTVKPEQLFAPEFAAAKLIDVTRSMSLSGRGKCWDWKGDEVKP